MKRLADMKKVMIIFSNLVISVGVMLYSSPNTFSQGKTTVKTNRNFMLVFDITDYSSQVEEAVTTFFNKVIQPGDQIVILSPLKYYFLTPQKGDLTKNQLIEDVIKNLKEDIRSSAHKYMYYFEEMEGIATTIASRRSYALTGSRDLDEALKSYKKACENMMELRSAYESRLMNIAKIFRSTRGKGDNHMLMFFQKQFRPIPKISLNQRFFFDALETFQATEYKYKLDLKKIKFALTHASVKVHFLYLRGKKHTRMRGIEYLETTSALYKFFSKISKATGGINLKAATPSLFLKKLNMLYDAIVEVEVIDIDQAEE